MTLQVKILLSYLALGGGAGGIYLGANNGFGNSAMEGVVEISEPDSNPQLVAAETSVEESQTPLEKPQDVEVQSDEDKREIPINAEITQEVKTNEKVEEVLVNDEKTEQTEASNNNKDAEPKPVLELQAAEEAPSTQPQELKANIPSPTPSKETKESKGSDSIKEPTFEQPTTKTELKVGKSSLGHKETKDSSKSNSKEFQCPEQLTQSEKDLLDTDIGLLWSDQSGTQWIHCVAKHMRNRNKN